MASVEETLTERGKTHGDWKVQSYISRRLKGAAASGTNWKRMTAAQQEAVDMILHKISRIVEGNSDEKDHWLDIAGYATLETR